MRALSPAAPRGNPDPPGDDMRLHGARHHAAAGPTAAELPPPPPRRFRRHDDSSAGFAAIAALGAAFAGFISHDRNPDLLVTGVAMGVTFVGAFVALHVLRIVYRITVQLAKVAVPVAAVILLGCAFDWPWAERAADWALRTGSHGAAVAKDTFEALRSRARELPRDETPLDSRSR